jgi:hypothetical protein
MSAERLDDLRTPRTNHSTSPKTGARMALHLPFVTRRHESYLNDSSRPSFGYSTITLADW